MVVKNVLSNSQIQKLLIDLEDVKKKKPKKHNQFFHKTADNKFNTIHNIQILPKRAKLSS